MLISIITVVKNDLARLQKTISSLNKFYNDKNFEHIIVDGASKDKTVSFIKKIKNKNLIFSSSKDYGIYDAMNQGFKLSSGDFIIFLNAGDILIASKKYLIDTLNKFLKTEINIICFPFKHELSGQSISRYPKLKNKDKLPTSHQAMFFSKLFLERNKYSLDYKIASDFDLYLKSDLKNVIIISERNPISIVEFDGVASKNLRLSYNEYKIIISKKYSGISKIFYLIKINMKATLIIFLKKLFSKNIIFRIRKCIFYS